MDIINGIKKDDEKAWRRLYAIAGYKKVEKYILRNSGDNTDAMDAYHYALISFSENLKKETFKLTTTIESYIFSLAKYYWLKEIRRKGKTIEDNTVELLEDLKLTGNNLEDVNEWTEIEIKVRHLIEEMGDTCKKILFGYYLEGLDYEELAEKYGYTEKSVRNMKSRYIIQIRNHVQKIGIHG